MRYRQMLAAIVALLALGVYAQSTSVVTDDVTRHAKAQWQKSYVPAITPVKAQPAVPTQQMKAQPVAVTGVILHMRLRPYTPPPPPVYYYYYNYNYVQPYQPYYGYNPPYAYNGIGSGGYGSNYGQIVPAPPFVAPPAYIPSFTEPIPPQPMIVEITPHGIIRRPDPHFQLEIIPLPPNYLTTGSAIYQTPSPYYYGPYPPYYGAP